MRVFMTAPRLMDLFTNFHQREGGDRQPTSQPVDGFLVEFGARICD